MITGVDRIVKTVKAAGGYNWRIFEKYTVNNPVSVFDSNPDYNESNLDQSLEDLRDSLEMLDPGTYTLHYRSNTGLGKGLKSTRIRIPANQLSQQKSDGSFISREEITNLKQEVREQTRRDIEYEQLKADFEQLRQEKESPWNKAIEALLPYLPTAMKSFGITQSPAIAGTPPPQNVETQAAETPPEINDLEDALQRLHEQDPALINNLSKLADLAESNPEFYQYLTQQLNNPQQ